MGNWMAVVLSPEYGVFESLPGLTPAPPIQPLRLITPQTGLTRGTGGLPDKMTEALTRAHPNLNTGLPPVGRITRLCGTGRDNTHPRSSATRDRSRIRLKA